MTKDEQKKFIEKTEKEIITEINIIFSTNQ